MSFSDTLRKLLESKDMKAADLARATGLSEAAISDYLKGKKEPRGKQSVGIAQALGISLDVLWETEFSDVLVNKPQATKFLTSAEVSQKYSSLDEHGKRTVCAVIREELDRIEQSAMDNNVIPLMVTRIPHVLQGASAGTGNFADNDIDGYWTIEYNGSTKYCNYLMDVTGDSMEPDYSDGDILLIETTNRVEVGEVGIFIHGGERYVKVYRGEYLESLNPQYNDIPLEDGDLCIGKVIGVLDPERIIEQ